MSTAAAAATEKTFLQYLQSLSWEEVINVLVESDPYYNVAGLVAERERRRAAPASRRSLLGRVADACGAYVRTSSKTRLLVHGLVTGYLILAARQLAQQLADGAAAVTAAHGVLGLLVVPLALLQQETLPRMSRRYHHPTGAVAFWRGAHCVAGAALAASTALLALFGLIGSPDLRPAAAAYTWRALCLPVALLVPATIVPAAAYRGRLAHGVAGALLLRADLLVPLARLLEAAARWQGGDDCHGRCVAVAAVIVVIWAARDVAAAMRCMWERYRDKRQRLQQQQAEDNHHPAPSC